MRESWQQGDAASGQDTLDHRDAPSGAGGRGRLSSLAPLPQVPWCELLTTHQLLAVVQLLGITPVPIRPPGPESGRIGHRANRITYWNSA